VSKAACDLLPDNICDCHPKHFFNMQILPDFVQKCLINTTIAEAVAEGTGHGGTIYTDYGRGVKDDWVSLCEWPFSLTIVQDVVSVPQRLW
jgi:hypothetical protein